MKFKTSDIYYKAMLSLSVLDAAFNNTILNDSFKNIFHKGSLLLILLLAILCVLSKKYKEKHLILTVVLLTLSLVSYKLSGNSDIFVSILVVMLAWKTNLDDILKIIFRIRFLVFTFVVLLSLVGILDAGTIANSSAEKGILFGYAHANTFAGSAGIILFLMFAIHRNNIKRIHICISIIADLLIFYFSRSRTFLVIVTVTILLILAMNLFKHFNRKVLKLSKYVLPILLLLLLMFIIFRFNNIAPDFIDIIDKIMNGRILLSCMNLMYYPVTIMGQKVDLSLIAATNKYYALDNGFIFLLIHYGIVGFTVIGVLQQWAIVHCIKMKEPILCSICIMILCWMMYEGMMVSATSNFTLLFSVTMINNEFHEQSQKGELS